MKQDAAKYKEKQQRLAEAQKKAKSSFVKRRQAKAQAEIRHSIERVGVGPQPNKRVKISPYSKNVIEEVKK